MKFSYNWLKDYIPLLPQPKKLAEILTLHSFEVEMVEKFGDDWVFSIDILPNRFPDAASHRGLAREIAALLKKKIKIKKPPLKRESSSMGEFLEIKVLKKDACPRYSAAMVRGVRVGPSPKWLGERLRAVGLEPINNVVDGANYAMLDIGQPLHVFDFDKLDGAKKKTIFVRGAENGEEFVSLDDIKYKLSPDNLVIADQKGVLALAGIKGAKRPEISAETRTIVIEAANFSGPGVRKTARSLNLMTDAASRFASALDPNLTFGALEEVSSLIQKFAGGEILKGIKDFYPKPEVLHRVMLRSDKVIKVLGIDIPQKDMIDIMERLSFEVKDIKKEPRRFLVVVPTIRRDIIIEEDLIEEIGRIYGYEKIKPSHLLGELVLPERNEEIFWKEIVQDALKGLGYTELCRYSFLGGGDLKVLNGGDLKRVIEIQNPARPEFVFLRPYLSLKILESAAKALAGHEAVRFFEIGKVYGFPAGKTEDTGDLEEENLTIAIGFQKGKPGEAFFELKGALTSLFESLGISEVWFDDVPASSQELNFGIRRIMHPFRSAQIRFNGALLGVIGEVDPEAMKNARGGIAFLEINFRKLIKLAEEEKEFKPISRYPSLVRDIAILVPSKTKVEKVLDVIENAGGELLIDTDLFDIYEGENIPEAMKNLAFRLYFQAYDRTLSDKEANAVMEKIIKSLEENERWEIRK